MSCVAALAMLAGLAPTGRASDLAIDGVTAATAFPGDTTHWTITGTPGAPVFLMLDTDPGPTSLFGNLLDLGFSPALLVLALPPVPGGGELAFDIALPPELDAFGVPLYAVAAVADAVSPHDYDYSNGASLTLRRRSVQLAGEPLPSYPHFMFVRAFNEGETLHVAVDPSQHPEVVGVTADIYVVPSKTPAEWALDDTLTDATAGGAEAFTFVAGSITANTIQVDGGSLSGGVGPEIGVPFDVVIDLDRDGHLGPDDLIDGYDDVEAGLYIVHDLTQPGPYAVTETLYSGGSFLGQNTFYPSNIAELGELPLIVVSHGNGHNYQWYDHIGDHMASYGYIVMSHQNNTVPGVEAASLTTLSNTEWFLGNLDIIDGGVLQGHVDTHHIVWIGHSRGGEGVAIAYDRLYDGVEVPVNYSIDDITLVSSIAPTGFDGPNLTNTHDEKTHVWVGAADNDVNGCTSSNVTQSYHVSDRATNQRGTICLYGAGHGDFHNSTGSVASGPCLIGKANTHAIMRGYLLPLVAHHVYGNLPAEDFLWRQWESFKPIRAPTDPCVVVNLTYRQGVEEGKFAIDDFQANPDWFVSSSGGAVTGTVSDLFEDVLDDTDSNFTADGDSMNGMTFGRPVDETRGLVFEYTSDSELTFEVTGQGTDAAQFAFLSFRACQSTRDPLTTAVLDDQQFTVELRDGAGHTSDIPIGVFGGGVEEPYQRTGCGTGAPGWNNEFETIRIRLEDFTRDGSGVDLTDLAAVTFRFGPSWGTAQGRLGLDDLELISE
ncbi:MAG: hypothetical protein H6828_15915 [Planctomycetes bacterium]|nr:hypothetical protein [Planctomycetota bacterium]